MGNRKLLFDKNRHGNKIGGGVYIEGLTIDQIKDYLDGGYKLHGIDGWIEADVDALNLPVLASENFNIAPNHSITFEDYTLYRVNLSGSKVMLKIGAHSPAWGEIAVYEQLKAYLDKFGGKDNLYDNPWDEAKRSEYYIKNKDELDALTWTELKNYLKLHKIDAPYDLRSESLTRDALYADIEAGAYNVERK